MGYANHEAPGNPQGPEGLQETVSWLRELVGDDLGQALQLGLFD